MRIRISVLGLNITLSMAGEYHEGGNDLQYKD